MTTRQATPDILDNILTGAPGQPQATMLLLQCITNDGGTQMRAGMDPDTIKEYQDAINESEAWPFPPVVVYHDGDKYWLADGFHRVNAAHRSGKHLEIPADIRAGTRRDAVLHAAGANASHGLRRTNADKRRAVETLLRDEEWRQWSDQEIGRRCWVDPKTVSTIRREMTATLEIPESMTRKGADGRTINTANIGASRPAPRVEIFEIEQVVWEAASQQHTGAGDLRVIAKQRIGLVWQLCVKRLPPGTPYRDISQAFNNVAEQIAQKQREQALMAPTIDMHQGAGRTPPPPLSVDDLVDELRPHTESATVAAIEAAAHGSHNALLLRCKSVISDFSYRESDLAHALQRIADERRASHKAAPVVANGDQPLPNWANTPTQAEVQDAFAAWLEETQPTQSDLHDLRLRGAEASVWTPMLAWMMLRCRTTVGIKSSWLEEAIAAALPAWAQADDEPARQQQLVEALFDLTRNEYAEWIQAAIDGKHPRIFVMCENMARDYHGCNLKDALRQVVQRRHDAGQLVPMNAEAGEAAAPQQESAEQDRPNGALVDRTGVLSVAAQKAGYTAWATYRDGREYGAGARSPDGARSTGGPFNGWRELADWADSDMQIMQRRQATVAQPARHPQHDELFEFSELFKLAIQETNRWASITGEHTAILEAQRGLRQLVARTAAILDGFGND